MCTHLWKYLMRDFFIIFAVLHYSEFSEVNKFSAEELKVSNL